MGIMKKTVTVSGAVMRVIIGVGATALLIFGIKKHLDNNFYPITSKKEKSIRKN